ncbi:SDR family NAD(P)-dependent oxidoreductase [Shigella flexneri]
MDDVINLNIKSVFFMSQAAAKHFIAQGNGGKIINIASTPPSRADPCAFLYRIKKRRDGCDAIDG